MKLVLDSNIFCQDYRLASTNFRVLRDGLHLLPADLKIPEIVIDEVSNRYREILQERTIEIKRAKAVVARMLAKTEDHALQAAACSPDQEEWRYRNWLLSELERMGAEILPYPTVSHKDVVRRELQRRRPFRRKGSGYRDYLIWETIRRQMVLGTERLAFITANSTDFGEAPRLASDLADDLMNVHRFELFSSLKTFNEEKVLPKLKLADGLKKRLEEESGATLDIFEFLQSELLGMLQLEELQQIVVGFPDGVGSVYASSIAVFHDIKIQDLRELSDDEKLLMIAVEIDAEFGVDVDWDDYQHHSEVREWMGEGEPEFSWSSTQVVERLKVEMRLVLDRDGERVVGKEFSYLEGPFGEIDLENW